ncbi:hypothetical protein NBRC3257_3008 [Gluconobacter thailandicus NBRC 3257]|uniref:Transposase n=1 Tax=Gluconobacter thailandicus NBRC 3257 TaxID=1381097 RepID=A0ABQ0J0N1_GLUTH|nr:hypothetical protein NBRC3257_3008 [Gluconobacter thailandicus NBRC 3257]
MAELYRKKIVTLRDSFQCKATAAPADGRSDPVPDHADLPHSRQWGACDFS